MVAKKKSVVKTQTAGEIEIRPGEFKTVPITQAQAMMNMIENASQNPDVDIDKLDRLMAMFERTQEEEKKREFSASMVATQAEIPVIKKELENKQTHSFYTDLKEIIKVVKEIYTKNNLSLSFGEADSPIENNIRVICDVTHANGYSKQYYTDQPLDIAGIQGSVNKTATHAKGSTFTYARRYLTGLIFNLAFGEDDDGNSAGEPITFISEKAVEEIKKKLEEIGGNLEMFMKNFDADVIEEIKASDYERALRLLHDREELGKKKEARDKAETK